MAGLVDLLSIAKGALQTHQKALNVTGHNIANAATPGYTRQTLIQTEAVPLRTPQGLVGRGVTDDGVLSQRDTFLDAAYRTQLFLYLKSCGRDELSTWNLWGGADAPAQAAS